MKIETIEFRISGKPTMVRSAEVAGRRIIVTGKWLKKAEVMDEELVEGGVVPDPETMIKELKASGLKADILTFPQQLTESQPKYNYHYEWDNAAVAFTSNFTEWWEKKLPQESRKNARRAGKRGVLVQVAKFDDDFIKGIKAIYDETPVRQGRRFWHFGKDFERVKMENATYLERSEFIGAYFEGELIGFLKFVCVDKTARIMQILSKAGHQDKRPTNALIAKAVEVCQQKGMLHLVYSKFSFGRKNNSQLAEFKKRNGFERLEFPRYHVPLTLKGSLALKLKLHRSLLETLPPGLIEQLLKVRAAIVNLRTKNVAQSSPQTLAAAGAGNANIERVTTEE